ncbi:MAG: hypothetical protein Q8Q81_12570 [Oxalobacteraceae bacterium]|nr:hypothetical protein [Oxalobacteraceae bacterium]
MVGGLYAAERLKAAKRGEFKSWSALALSKKYQYVPVGGEFPRNHIAAKICHCSAKAAPQTNRVLATF